MYIFLKLNKIIINYDVLSLLYYYYYYIIIIIIIIIIIN